MVELELDDVSQYQYKGTSLIGYLKGAKPADINKVVGAYYSEGDGYKTLYEWAFTINGHVFTIYDYKGDRDWHIGGRKDSDLDLLRSLVPDFSILRAQF